MPAPAPKPPFDPIWGAWMLLLVMVLGIIADSLFLMFGCAVLQVAAMCEHNGENLRQVAMEVITAIALLISQRRS